MSESSSHTKKRYHAIGEVADMIGVSKSVIRFWENEFEMIRPRKTRKGDRLFTHKDIEKLELIYHLTREQGYKLKGAKKKLRHNRQETEDKFQLIRSLKRVRKFLEQLREEI